MNRPPDGKGPEGSARPFVGAAGWLGVVVVVAGAVSFIVHAPRYSPELPGNRPDTFSAVSAAYTLAAIWKRIPSDAKAFERVLADSADFSAAARLLGLRALPIRVTPASIAGVQRPMILFLVEDPDVVVTRQFLEGRPRKTRARYVVLAEVQDGDAVVLDPVAGRFTIPVADLVESVGAVGTVWVPNP